MKLFKRKPVEYWIKHQQKLKKDIKLKSRIALFLIVLYILLGAYNILLLVIVISITGYIFLDLFIDILSIEEVKTRLRSTIDS